jgi:hypothetical protein
MVAADIVTKLLESQMESILTFAVHGSPFAVLSRTPQIALVLVVVLVLDSLGFRTSKRTRFSTLPPFHPSTLPFFPGGG